MDGQTAARAALVRSGPSTRPRGAADRTKPPPPPLPRSQRELAVEVESGPRTSSLLHSDQKSSAAKQTKREAQNAESRTNTAPGLLISQYRLVYV